MDDSSPQPFSFSRDRILPILVLAVVATVFMATLVAAFFYLHGGTPIHSGEVVSLNVIPIAESAETTRGIEGMAGSHEAFREVFVIARVSVTNLSEKSQTLHQVTGSLMPHNHFTMRAVALNPQQIERAATAYPQLRAFEMKSLPDNPTLAPHETTTAQWVFVYPITAAQWQQRDGFGLEISYTPPIGDLFLLLKGKMTSGNLE